MTDKLSSKYHGIAESVADLIVEKQKAYGDAFGECGQFLRLLYPNGIPPDRLDDAQYLLRIWDKMKRIATHGAGNDPMNEDPFRDIIGYSLLALGKMQK